MIKQFLKSTMGSVVTAVLLMCVSTALAQDIIGVKMHGNGNGYYFGKVSVPKGIKYKVECSPKDGVNVNVYRSRIDGAKIYLTEVDHFMSCHWIDATDQAHAFIVRSTTADDVMFVPVTDAEDKIIEDDEDYYYFDKSEGKKNMLRYTESAVSNELLKSSPAYNGKFIYVMSNPSRNGLAFALLDPSTTKYDLPKNSLYILGSVKASRLIVDFEGEESTGILNSYSDKSSYSDNHDAHPSLYNLQGLQITQPHKGLYIRNGEKIIY